MPARHAASLHGHVRVKTHSLNTPKKNSRLFKRQIASPALRSRPKKLYLQLVPEIEVTVN
jgi:hypothetical protein